MNIFRRFWDFRRSKWKKKGDKASEVSKDLETQNIILSNSKDLKGLATAENVLLFLSWF